MADFFAQEDKTIQSDNEEAQFGTHNHQPTQLKCAMVDQGTQTDPEETIENWLKEFMNTPF